VRVAEHGRHLLDLRHPDARAHLDEVVDRLVGDFGVGFFKMDYNTMPGPGTDRDAVSAGDGLLGHARALLDWLDDVQRRHPQLLIESCASGAMRMDYAMLARLHVQSTSDQQDPVLYAPIAAAAPASILPEQAGHWAYPNPEMSDELFALALVNGILGRMYLSGYLNRMPEPRRALIAEAIAVHRTVLATERRSHPRWPIGLPDWEDPWVCAGLTDADGLYLSLWSRTGEPGDAIRIPLPEYEGRELEATIAFPAGYDGWSLEWSSEDGILTVAVEVDGPSARILRLTPR
jgi:alpha-galactosidase